MAATITVNATMSLVDSPVNTSQNPGTVTVTPTTSLNSQGVYSVPTTSGGVIIPLGGITTPGIAQFTNLDATNYVELLTATSGTVFCRIKPGGTALFQYGPNITAPAWIAHTAVCKVMFLITDGA